MGNPVRPIGAVPAPGPVPVTPRVETLPFPREVNPRLNAAAERLGRVIGIVVERAREMTSKARELQQRLTRSRRTGPDTATSDWKDTARQSAYQARNRADQIAHQYPIQVIAGSAGAAFIVGFALRIWRANHARSE